LHATQANTREGNVVVAQDAIKFPKEAFIASVDHAFDMGRSDGAEHRDPVMAPAVRGVETAMDYPRRRQKFGVTTPSTSDVVQPEYDSMRPPGVTNHLVGHCRNHFSGQAALALL
jgi:hypothetical protein